jgi:hypothetical protein
MKFLVYLQKVQAKVILEKCFAFGPSIRFESGPVLIASVPKLVNGSYCKYDVHAFESRHLLNRSRSS